MTPAPLDRGSVQAKLRMLSELLDDLERVGAPAATQLARERMLRHAVERILMQLVDLAVAVNTQLVVAWGGTAPATYRDSFLLLADAGVLDESLAHRLAPSAGLRNVLAHEYVSVDLTLVAAAVPLAVEGYRDYVRQVARALARG